MALFRARDQAGLLEYAKPIAEELLSAIGSAKTAPGRAVKHRQVLAVFRLLAEKAEHAAALGEPGAFEQWAWCDYWVEALQ